MAMINHWPHLPAVEMVRGYRLNLMAVLSLESESVCACVRACVRVCMSVYDIVYMSCMCVCLSW